MSKQPEKPTPESAAKGRKADWRSTQAKIQSVFYKILNEEKHVPTQTEIAHRLGLSVDTIQRHYKHFDFDQLIDDCKQYTEAVLQATALSAINGNSRDRRLFFEVIHKFRKGIDVQIKNPEELTSDERRDEIRNLIFELMADNGDFVNQLGTLLEGAQIAGASEGRAGADANGTVAE